MIYPSHNLSRTANKAFDFFDHFPRGNSKATVHRFTARRNYISFAEDPKKGTVGISVRENLGGYSWSLFRPEYTKE